MFRNFFSLVLIALPVSILMGVFWNNYFESMYIVKLVQGTLTAESFVDDFTYAFTASHYGNEWWLVFPILLLFALTQSILVVKVSRHMYVGELTTPNIKSVFNVFPTMLIYVAVMYLCFQVLSLIPVGIVVALKNANLYAVSWVCLGLGYLSKVAIAYVFGALLCAFPLCYCDNYNFGAALSYSARLTAKDQKYLFTFCFIYPTMQLVIALVTVLTQNGIVSVILSTVDYLFFTLFIPCLAFSKYYFYIGRDRKDLSQKIFD